MKNNRYSFIDAMLIDHNEIARRHLCRAFGIAAPTATRLLRGYKEKYPDNLEFDNVAKCYRRSHQFKAQSLDILSVRFLEAAQIMADENIIDA